MKARKAGLASLPKTQDLQRLLWPVSMFFLVLIAVLYGIMAVRPLAGTMDGLAASLGQLRQSVLSDRAARGREAKALSDEIMTLEQGLVGGHNVFISKLMAAQILDIVYSAAQQQGVRIVQMENHPTTQKDDARAYDVEVYRLQAEGSFGALTSFLRYVDRRIDQQAVLFQNLSITGKDQTHTLIVDLVLYSSPLAPMTYPQTGQILQSLPQPMVPPGQAGQGAMPRTELSLLVRPLGWPSTWPWPPTRHQQTQWTYPDDGQGMTYIVQADDTLLSIAFAHGVPVEQIVAANGLDQSGWYVGKELRIPTPKAP